MPPERFDLIALNPHSDVYALCACETEDDILGAFVRRALARPGHRVERVPAAQACARHESYLRTQPEFAEAFATRDVERAHQFSRESEVAR